MGSVDIPRTRERAIAVLVEEEVARWGSPARSRPHHESYKQALNSLADLVESERGTTEYVMAIRVAANET